MVIIKIDGKDVSVPKESAAAIEAGLKATVKVDESAVEKEKKRADELQGQLDQLKKDEASKNSEQTKKDEAKKLSDMVKLRATLLTQATAVLPKDDHTKLDEMDEIGIMKAVLLKLDPKAKFDGLSDDYIKGAFNAATKSAPKAEKKADELGSLLVHGETKGVHEKKDDGTVVLTVDGFNEMRKQKLKDAYKEPLNPKVAA